ncbi:MAG TPA: D-alanyl-D-alanine carboxypeptidase family protein [Solirubrobacterales bacterium]|nr:D-alanyl-D-alanine carboxypeptidase family protein [Solirubrobacterales bacterium]
MLAAIAAGPVAVGDPPPPAVAKASSGAGLPTAPPAATTAAPRLAARAWVLIDARTGERLASHAVARHLPIASTTKMMTAYVALHELPLTKIVRAAPYTPIYGESLLGLRPGQRISVRDLLYGLILRSGNDAAYDLARAAAGSEAGFVRQMNMRAAALGLSDTHYANPIGLDEAGNYSSAGDLATLAQSLLRIPTFARIADSRTAQLRSLHPPRRISTINDLLWREPWATGVKTGHTFDAAYVLVGAGRRKGVELISAVLGVSTETGRDLESIRLLDYGFSLYRQHTPIRAGSEVASPSIRYTGGELPLEAARTVRVGVRRGQRLDVSVRAPGEVEGPIPDRAVLGRAIVTVDGRRAASVPLRASRAIPKAALFDRVRSFLSTQWPLIMFAAFVILIGTTLLWRRARHGKRGEDMSRLSREQSSDVGRERHDEGVAK